MCKQRHVPFQTRATRKNSLRRCWFSTTSNSPTTDYTRRRFNKSVFASSNNQSFKYRISSKSSSPTTKQTHAPSVPSSPSSLSPLLQQQPPTLTTMRTRSQRNLSITTPSTNPPSQPLTTATATAGPLLHTTPDESKSKLKPCHAERILQLEQCLEQEQHRYEMLVQRHTALRERVASLVADLESRAARSCEIWEDLIERVDNIVHME